MPEYTLKESFHIDNGELDGLRPQECFVLGVEWAGVYQHIISDSDDPLYMTIHHANKSRLQGLCDKYKRFHDYVQCEEPLETYGTLFVGSKRP
jgi:hypothetical protein